MIDMNQKLCERIYDLSQSNTSFRFLGKHTSDHRFDFPNTYMFKNNPACYNYNDMTDSYRLIYRDMLLKNTHFEPIDYSETLPTERWHIDGISKSIVLSVHETLNRLRLKYLQFSKTYQMELREMTNFRYSFEFDMQNNYKSSLINFQIVVNGHSVNYTFDITFNDYHGHQTVTLRSDEFEKTVDMNEIADSAFVYMLFINQRSAIDFTKEVGNDDIKSMMEVETMVRI